MTDTTPNAEQADGGSRKRRAEALLPPTAAVGNLWLALGAARALLVASIYVIFGLGNQLGLYVPLETEYFYFMIAVLLPLPFLIYPSAPASRRHRQDRRLHAPASLAFAVPAYFAVQMSS